MRLLIVVAVAALLASPALALEGPEKHFARAELAMKEGRLQEAAEGFELVIREWPKDGEFTPKAWLGLAACHAMMGKTDEAQRLLGEGKARYRDEDWWDREAKKLSSFIHRHAAAKKQREAFLRELHEFLARRKAELVEEGVRGDELERVLQEEKRRFLEEHDAERRGRDLDRIIALWKEQGVSEEEIEDRVRRMKKDRARAETMRREFDDVVRRWREEGVPPEEIERRMDGRRRQHEEQEERRWRERHANEMEDARREFIHLAERLGIPAEAAERFLEEHSRKRHPRVREEGLEARVREIEEHLHGVMERMGPLVHELEERLGGMERHIEKAHDGVERELGEVHDAMGREIDDRLERLEEEVADRLEAIEEEVAGALEDIVERLERIEERLGRRGERKRDR